MPDSFTETSSQSIFGRLGNAIKGVLIGIILIPLSIILLFWNEGRAVKTARSLKEGAAAVVSVSADSVGKETQGKLIHVSGKATTEATLEDPMFNVSQNAIRLSRKVEMFQWKEKKKQDTKKKLGGGTETTTTYTYTKDWSDRLLSSADFKHPEGHENPAAMTVEDTSLVASDVKMGAFGIPSEIIAKMKGDQPLQLAGSAEENLPDDIKDKMKRSGNGYYLGANPANPAIGDQRVTFTVLKPATFSILARQTGDSLDAYPTKAGDTIERVESGDVAAAEMFKHAARENTLMTWGLRLGGILLMAFGIGLILSPISTLADVIPFIGDIVGMGTGLAALIIAACVSTLVIAVAWFSVRPLLSVALIAVAIGAVIFGKRMGAKKQLAVAPALR